MGGNFFSTGGSKSVSRGATKQGLRYLDEARAGLRMGGQEAIQDTLQARLDALSSMMGNLASMAQISSMRNAQDVIPGATNSAATQALLNVLPQVQQMMDVAYQQAGEQKLGLEDTLAKLAAQYAGLTGYSKQRSWQPGLGTTMLGSIGGGLGKVFGSAQVSGNR